MSLARDVARRAGVSTATVSRVLNRSGYVSPERRARVEKAVRELGYEANALARSLRQGRTRVLGLVLTSAASPFFAQAARAIEEIISQAGYDLVLCITDDDPAQERRHLAVLRHLRVDGLIASPCGDNDDQIVEMAGRGVPIALLARRARRADAGLDTVVADTAGGTSQAVEHLISLGHRRIGVLPGLLRHSSARDCLAGYWRAITRHGLPYDDALVEECPDSAEAGRAKAQRLLRQRDRPSAIFVGHSLVMLGTLQALREEGLHVPQDVAVVGFGDCDWAPFVDPPLSVVAQPLREMGWTAARLLLERIEAGAGSPPREVVLPTRLIVRQSCGGGTALESEEDRTLEPWPRAASE